MTKVDPRKGTMNKVTGPGNAAVSSGRVSGGARINPGMVGSNKTSGARITPRQPVGKTQTVQPRFKPTSKAGGRKMTKAKMKGY